MIERFDEVKIASRDYWFKVIEFLQQNWALIDTTSEGVVVWFMGDTGGVFDQIRFPSMNSAVVALERNGFKRYAEDQSAQKLIAVPAAPFRLSDHPNGPIYSSGRFWK